MSLPTTTPAWLVKDSDVGEFPNLELVQDVPIPSLGSHDVLVRIEAVSLNYRDLMIAQGTYPFGLKKQLVPCSDGAGIVVALGSETTQFSVGDRVCTLFNTYHQTNPLTPQALKATSGSSADGTLRKYAVFPDFGLILAPPSLNAVEASTLTVAPLTAWNSFYGLPSKTIKPGDWVLTQGSGGVSLSAIQLAAAAGATVVATTSSEEKAKTLRKLGASHVINYRQTPNWGEVARSLTPSAVGFDHIVEVGGGDTLKQSLKAIKLEGVISLIGALDGGSDFPGLPDFVPSFSILRGVLVGSKQQFEDMNLAIEAAKIRPVVDPKDFFFDDVIEAFKYQKACKHFGKVVVRF
ncbi:uncharacterized protein NECHADRAFT_52764 [Fusarium vanettenii 77-13-4]|uniref:Enoyl reductase (ER) domain-containing protein n=1 Tax=Fusarium vanettenii (strain ATCC MYA-4622 / CBS 123669 / FGSC 9596 / NRRL 45880 / 77-13-4) TaxID=660122 RepID=C7ZMR0_FUSV7|nr:uncharacterized protein NECHADRAFT_52764 [Fusarium vanettenii 77-13-4]EEU34716.1 hypothetical protein NECHADRAFT_52764 [Fusarium vanettenii 77-13-4]